MENAIRRMYWQIHDYRGDFGDGIDTGPFNPFHQLEAAGLSDFVRVGMSVSALCYLATAIDNSTYEDAVASDSGKRASALLNARHGELREEVRNALEAFFMSESDFHDALRIVYTQVVRKELKNGENST